MGSYKFSGTLGKDPELRFKPDGSEYCKFTVAENTHKRDDSRNKTMWWDCVVWDKDLAVLIASKYRKGGVISIASSKLEPREFNGNKSFNVCVWKLEDKKANSQSGDSEQYAADHEGSSFMDDDEIPF